MQTLPIIPSPFFWQNQTLNSDLRVHEWIHQIKGLQDKCLDQSWDVVLYGVPLSKSSISPSGASEFPEAFRRSWKSFYTYNMDYSLDLKTLKVADLGDVSMHLSDIERSHQNIKQISFWVSQSFPKSLPIAIGGDHSITSMIISGIKQFIPESSIGILQFDTHLDLRDLKPHGRTNGTPIRYLIESNLVKGENVFNIGLHGFYNGTSLIDFAKTNKVNYITLKEARRQGIPQTVANALKDLSKRVDFIYLTVDMDVLDICYAKGVPASTPGGMYTTELFEAVYTAGLFHKVKAMDIVCLDPLRDDKAQSTVKAGTHVFLSFLSGYLSRFG